VGADHEEGVSRPVSGSAFPSWNRADQGKRLIDAVLLVGDRAVAVAHAGRRHVVRGHLQRSKIGVTAVRIAEEHVEGAAEDRDGWRPAGEKWR